MNTIEYYSFLRKMSNAMEYLVEYSIYYSTFYVITNQTMNVHSIVIQLLFDLNKNNRSNITS